ncbi:7625_t:CDS:1, partial [Acaulospora colombiana]
QLNTLISLVHGKSIESILALQSPTLLQMTPGAPFLFTAQGSTRSEVTGMSDDTEPWDQALRTNENLTSRTRVNLIDLLVSSGATIHGSVW